MPLFYIECAIFAAIRRHMLWYPVRPRSAKNPVPLTLGRVADSAATICTAINPQMQKTGRIPESLAEVAVPQTSKKTCKPEQQRRKGSDSTAWQQTCLRDFVFWARGGEGVWAGSGGGRVSGSSRDLFALCLMFRIGWGFWNIKNIVWASLDVSICGILLLPPHAIISMPGFRQILWKNVVLWEATTV